MSVLSRLISRFRKDESVQSQREIGTIDNLTTEIGTEKVLQAENPKSQVETDKLDLVLKDLASISMFLRLHDQRLTEHDNRTSERLTRLLMSRKLIEPSKKAEVEQVLRECLESKSSREETVSRLMEEGVSRSSAYRYTRDLEGTGKPLES